jgi:hypothetical protein
MINNFNITGHGNPDNNLETPCNVVMALDTICLETA